MPRLVIGTRSAVFAPVADLGLVLVWDDGDDNLAEPRAPYPHAREVAMLRAHQLRCAAIIGGYARTAEAQALVRTRWAHDVVAARPVVRAAAPRVIALEDSGYAQERGSGRAHRPAAVHGIAGGAVGAAGRTSGAHSGSAPRICAVVGLRTVPRRDPLPALHRPAGTAGARVARPPNAAGAAGPNPHCVVRVVVRMPCGPSSWVPGGPPKELGRAFAGTSVITSGGDAVIREVGDGPALVVCTPGAEPIAEGGYGAALLLDAWALLGRQDLRAAEDTLRRWMAAAALVRSRADGGVVAVVAESAISTVQALIRWDPVGHADAELDGRGEVGLPPAVHMAAIDGTTTAVEALLDTAQLPDVAETLGPVELPRRRTPATGLGRPVPR